MKNPEFIKAAIELMNSAIALDQEAMQKLCEVRVPCNDALADHPTIQVGKIDENGRIVDFTEDDTKPYGVGLVGILNGIGGCNEHGGFIASHYDDNGQLTKFIELRADE